MIEWIIFSILILLLGFLILAITLNWFQEEITDTRLSEYILRLLQQAGAPGFEGTWTSINAVDGPRGDCNMYYTFVDNLSIVDSLEPNLLDDFQNPCLNGFNMALRKVERECLRETCINKEGQTINRGDIDYFYESCGNLEPCANIGLAISSNFSASQGTISANTQCLITNPAGQQVVTRVTPCRNVGINDAIFQVEIRASQDRYPFYNTAFNLKPDFEELSEQELNTEFNTFDGKTFTNLVLEEARIMRLAANECLAPTSLGDVEFVPCSTLPDNGYIWFLTPEMQWSSDVYFPRKFILAADVRNQEAEAIARYTSMIANAFSITYSDIVSNFLEAVPFRCYTTVGKWTNPPCTPTERSRTYARHLTYQANFSIRGEFPFPANLALLRWTINNFGNRTYPRTYNDIKSEALNNFSRTSDELNGTAGVVRELNISGSKPTLQKFIPCSNTTSGWLGEPEPCYGINFLTPNELEDLIP